MENNNTLDIHSHHANMWQNQSEMWEKHYKGLLEHSQKLVTKSAREIIRLEEAIEASYEAKNVCQITSENEREGMLGEMRIHKDIIRHTHGFVGEGMIKELASGEHKTLVAQSM